MIVEQTYPAPLFGAALADTWDEAWKGIGRHPPPGLRQKVQAAWSEEQRHYHDLRHLGECMALWQRWQGQALHAGEVALGLWFHDAVYDPQGADNELKSASWAARSLSAAGAGDEVAQRVFELVMATCHGEPALVTERDDAALLLDIDLAILGSPSERFEGYIQDIRNEYAWVPGRLYRNKRAAVLQGFAARERIYQTAPAAELLEAQAKKNLESAIYRLNE